MRTTRWILIGLLAATLTGCRDDPREISSDKYLMGRLHEAWKNARESLKSDQPNVGLLFSVHVFLSQRTPRRVEKEYQGADKEELLAKLRSLGDRFAAEIAVKLDLRPQQVRLLPGVTLAEIRSAFDELDKEYRQLEAMTTPK